MDGNERPERGSWAGRLASALVVAALLADGATQLLAPATIAGMMRETGFAMTLAPVLGTIMIACAILYAVPATAVLGAIAVTGFLGGAICAHVRLGKLGSAPQIVSALLGLMTWGGLYGRDPNIRRCLPLTRRPRHVDRQPTRATSVTTNDRMAAPAPRARELSSNGPPS